jgi:hypothetical protein
MENQNEHKNEANTIPENREIVQVGSTIYLFPRLPHEVDEQFFFRKNFITKRFPNTKKKFLDLTKMSMVCANKKFLECTYSPAVEKELKKLM